MLPDAMIYIIIILLGAFMRVLMLRRCRHFAISFFAATSMMITPSPLMPAIAAHVITLTPCCRFDIIITLIAAFI